MNNKNILTAILITYNHEKSIAKAIESTLEQETNFPFKIQIFDDYSTDNTTQICTEYAKKYPEKIELFTQIKNFGPGENFKKAVCQVNSKYWAYLEGDDYWCDKQKLQLCVDVLEKNPKYSICAHNTKICNINGNESFMYNNDSENHVFSFFNAPYLHMNARVFRTSCVNFTQLPVIFLSDTPMYFYFLSKGDIYFINRIMSVYNITEIGSWTSLSNLSQDFLHIRMYTFLSKYFDQSYSVHLILCKKHYIANVMHKLFILKIFNKIANKILPKSIYNIYSSLIYIMLYIYYLYANRRFPPDQK